MRANHAVRDPIFIKYIIIIHRPLPSLQIMCTPLRNNAQAVLEKERSIFDGSEKNQERKV
jgi:hypothetical protein